MSATLTDRYPTVCLSTLEEEVIEKAALLVFGVCVCVCVCGGREEDKKKKKKKTGVKATSLAPELARRSVNKLVRLV